jgi:predicted AAA+ superfamily ATPase
MIDALTEWNEWWSTKKVDLELVGRQRELSSRAEDFFSFNEIKTLTGLRRSGKSTLLYQLINHLLLIKKINPARVLFVNFEDPVLSKVTLNEIFNEYQTKINPNEKPYIFLDEVHRCKEWALFLRKLYDLKKIEQVFITDSSSKYIKSEYASVITGREINITIFPISLREYLLWKKVDIRTPYTRETKNKIKNSLGSYLQWGGLPDVVLKNSKTHKKILLNDYLNDIVHKDIVERYNVNYQKIKSLVDYLVANNGTLFSPRKYSKTYGLSLDSLNTYMGYLNEVFLFFGIPKFDYSIRSQQLSQKKVYLSDSGFHGSSGNRFSENIGRLYENAVFLSLQKKGKELYYWKGKGECDFTVKEGVKLESAIQVCSHFEPDTKDRELKGLLEAMETLKITNGLIITEKTEGEEKLGKKSIRYLPLWKYLLAE